MKIAEITTLLQAVRKAQQLFSDRPASAKFTYALAKAARVLQAEVDTHEEAVNAGCDMQAIQAHETRRFQMLLEAAEFGADGKPVIEGGNVRLTAPETQVPHIEATLTEEFPGIREQMIERNARLATLAGEDIDVTLHKVALGELPDLPADVVDALFPLIQD